MLALAFCSGGLQHFSRGIEIHYEDTAPDDKVGPFGNRDQREHAGGDDGDIGMHVIAS